MLDHVIKTPWSPYMIFQNIMVSILGVFVRSWAKAIWGSIIFCFMGSKHRGLLTWVSKTSWVPFLAFFFVPRSQIRSPTTVSSLLLWNPLALMILSFFYSMALVKLTLLFQNNENQWFYNFFYTMGWKHRGLPAWFSKTSRSPFVASFWSCAKAIWGSIIFWTMVWFRNIKKCSK